MRVPGGPEALQGGYHTREALRIWTCAFLLRGGIQARVVRFSRLALCHERSCGTDVAFCKLWAYGPATAPVPKLSGASTRGDAWGVLILQNKTNLATILCLFIPRSGSGPVVSELQVPWHTGCRSSVRTLGSVPWSGPRQAGLGYPARCSPSRAPADPRLAGRDSPDAAARAGPRGGPNPRLRGPGPRAVSIATWN